MESNPSRPQASNDQHTAINLAFCSVVVVNIRVLS
jgi:hypothetical protein